MSFFFIGNVLDVTDRLFPVSVSSLNNNNIAQ